MSEGGRKVFMEERTSSLLSITHSEIQNYGTMVDKQLLNTADGSDDSDGGLYDTARPQGNVWLRWIATAAAASTFMRVDVFSLLNLIVCGVLTKYVPQRRPPRIPFSITVVSSLIPIISMGITIYTLPIVSVVSIINIVPELGCLILCCCIYFCSSTETRPSSPSSSVGVSIQSWPIASLVLPALAVCSHPSLVALPLLWIFIISWLDFMGVLIMRED